MLKRTVVGALVGAGGGICLALVARKLNLRYKLGDAWRLSVLCALVGAGASQRRWWGLALASLGPPVALYLEDVRATGNRHYLGDPSFDATMAAVGGGTWLTARLLNRALAAVR